MYHDKYPTEPSHCLYGDHERSLLQKITKGDQRAFGVFFEQHQQVVFNIAYKLTRSRASAMEIVQDVFLKVWNKREELCMLDNPGAYINTIARNQSIDALRVLGRQVRRFAELGEIQLAKEDHQTEEALQFQETNRMLQLAIETLTPRQREVYQLCHNQGLKYQDAAGELDISPGTVHSHMKQALKNIRGYLKRLDILFLLMIWIHH
jgi:RNA polymerase sigma-70 factor (family 1)